MEEEKMDTEQFDLKECFDDFIEEYKENSLFDKQQLIVQELKEMIAMMQKICADNNISYDLIMNREILDLQKENYTQHDFAEAVYVYLQMLKETIGQLLDATISGE